MTGLIIVFCAIQQTQTNKHPAHRTIQTSMTIKYLIPRAHTNYEICSSIPTAAACAVVSLGNSTLLFLFRWKACFSFQLTCRLSTIFLLFCGCNPSFQSNLSSADALVWIRWRFVARWFLWPIGRNVVILLERGKERAIYILLALAFWNSCRRTTII